VKGNFVEKLLSEGNFVTKIEKFFYFLQKEVSTSVRCAGKF
jgi:hypothetical protein